METLIVSSIIMLAIFFLVSWLYISLALYFLPIIIGYVRKHDNLLGVTLLTIFLGWTFLGWLAALLWSLNSDVADNTED